MAVYDLLVLIHIFSAIIGIGPGFVMGYPVAKAKNMEELRRGYAIRNQIHVLVMIGGFLLLVTGVSMGILKPYLFKQIWYVGSLILYLIVLGIGPVLLSKKTKPIKKILLEYEGEQIPANYVKLANQLFFYERITNFIFIIIIVLMIIKPV